MSWRTSENPDGRTIAADGARSTFRHDGPVSLLDAERRFLSHDECRDVARRAFGFASAEGDTRLSLKSLWRGFLRWGRNEATLAGDQRLVYANVLRRIDGTSSEVHANQLDDRSLRAAVRTAEENAVFRSRRIEDPPPPARQYEYAKPVLWSDATYGQTTAGRAELVRDLLAPAREADLLSAGYIEVEGGAQSLQDERGRDLYYPYTMARCSLTVRDRKGTASGWAGLSHRDWGRIDAAALAQRAMEKCLASRNPVAIEPGRYTVILEPQAVADLVSRFFVIGGLIRMKRENNEENPGYPFFLRGGSPGFAKLGMQVVDERLTLGFDPMDPELAIVPVGFPDDEPLRAMNWIQHGVLTNLWTDREYALFQQREELGYPYPRAFRLSGGPTSVEEMVATTRRGLLVTRFSDIHVLSGSSGLMTGVTRDGLWLVENGKVSKAVKNLRFTESPMFVLNSIDQLGVPVATYSDFGPMIVPPIKSRDFSFTSAIDAI